VKGPLNGDGFLPIEVRGTFKVGQTLELLGPGMKNRIFQVKKIISPNNKEVETAGRRLMTLSRGRILTQNCDRN
jgi:hypothetical protein